MTTNKYHVRNGTYNISVSKTGYNTVTKSVLINGADKSETIELAVTTYTVTVSNIIPGSRLDVSSNGVTVMSETISGSSKTVSVNHGQSYTFVLTKDGSTYKRWENKTFTSNQTLSSDIGMLTISGTDLPMGTLTVKRDGVAVGDPISFNGQTVSHQVPGTYTIEFAATGFRTQTKTQVLTAGQTVSVTFSGADSYFTLTLNVSPNDALISVKDSEGNSVTTI